VAKRFDAKFAAGQTLPADKAAPKPAAPKPATPKK
jgi:hypothetical protein